MHIPLKVGLTGGIGTGKTLVAKIFEVLGIPVLYADHLAKELMNSDEELKQKLQKHFGKDIFNNDTLDRQKLSNIVFKDKAQLQMLNSIVHPAVINYSQEWMRQQKAPYAIKEAAIMIESGSYQDLDYIIGVTANKETIIDRVIKRDQITRAEVLQRMDKQMSNEEKMKYCDFVIINDEQHSLIKQCNTIHQQLLIKANESGK